MKQETLYWHNKSTGQVREEIREQINSHLWQSKEDGRYYTKGLIGWYDVTDNFKNYL